MKDAANPPSCYSFGAHVVFRQGFKVVQIQGVEFASSASPGKMGHYPVHFHMARQVPPNTFVKDSTINELHDPVDRPAFDARRAAAAEHRLQIHRPRLLSGERHRDRQQVLFQPRHLLPRGGRQCPESAQGAGYPRLHARQPVLAQQGETARDYQPAGRSVPLAHRFPASHGLLDHQRLERVRRQYGGRRRGLWCCLLARPLLEQRHGRRADGQQPAIRHAHEVDGLCRPPAVIGLCRIDAAQAVLRQLRHLDDDLVPDRRHHDAVLRRRLPRAIPPANNPGHFKAIASFAPKPKPGDSIDEDMYYPHVGGGGRLATLCKVTDGKDDCSDFTDARTDGGKPPSRCPPWALAPTATPCPIAR